MSISVRVAVWVPRLSSAQVFLRLYQDLAESASPGEPVLERRGLEPKSRSRKHQREVQSSEVDRSRIEAEAFATVESETKLAVGFATATGSGATLYPELSLHGRSYGSGYPARYDGFVNLSLGYKDLVEPSRHWVARKGRPRQVTPAIQSGILANTTGFFDAILRSIYSVETDTEHVVMYLEAGCPAADRASQIFHRTYREFTRDFQRIQTAFMTGYWSDELYGVETVEPGSPILDRGNPLWAGQTLPADHLAADSPAVERIRRFYASLTETRVQRLQEVPEDEIWAWLLESNLEKLGAQFDELPFGGWRLSTDPMDGLWPVYASFVDDFS